MVNVMKSKLNVWQPIVFLTTLKSFSPTVPPYMGITLYLSKCGNY